MSPETWAKWEDQFDAMSDREQLETMRALAERGRMSAFKVGGEVPATATQGDATMTDTQPAGVTSEESFKQGMRDWSKRIELAQAEGDHSLANRLHREQQEWIASVKGDAPIVGGAQRTA